MPYPIDILSATWGPSDVTSKVISIYGASTDPSNVFNYTPNVTDLGDPWPGNTKSFTIVYRTRITDPKDPQNYVYTQAMMKSCRERESISINIASDSLPPVQPAIPENTLYIFNATFSTLDVTNIVSGLRSNNNTTLNVPQIDSKFPVDPWVGVEKSVSVTYGYGNRYGTVNSIGVVAIKFNDTLNVQPPPPTLVILGADCNAIDVSEQITNLINQKDQTCTFTPSQIGPGGGTTVAILYKYGNQPIQLTIRNAEGSTPYTITPTATGSHTQYLNPLPQQAGVTNIISATWGNMSGANVSSMPWYRTIQDTMSVTPSNAFFGGLDPWRGTVKTAVVFFRYGLSGKVHRTSCLGVTNPVSQPLEDRSLLTDPLPARGILTANEFSPNFYLMGPNNKYVRYDSQSNGFYADQTEKTNATPFTTISGAKKLQFQAGNPSVTRYVSMSSDNLLTSVTDSSIASDFYYELVQSGATAIINMNLVRLGSNNSTIPLLLSIATTSDGQLYNNGQLTLISVYKTVNSIEYSFQFEWIKAQGLRDLSHEELLAQGIDLGDSCTAAWFKVLYDVTIGFMETISGFPALFANTRIVQWYARLTAPLRDIVNRVMASLRTAAGPLLKPEEWDLNIVIPLATVAISTLYTSGLLWDLIKYLVNSLSLWDMIKAVAKVGIFLAEKILPMVIPGAQALIIVQYMQYTLAAATYVGGLYLDFVAATKACSPGTTEKQRIRQIQIQSTLKELLFSDSEAEYATCTTLDLSSSPSSSSSTSTSTSTSTSFVLVVDSMSLSSKLQLMFEFYMSYEHYLFGGEHHQVPIHMKDTLEELQNNVGYKMLQKHQQ